MTNFRYNVQFAIKATLFIITTLCCVTTFADVTINATNFPDSKFREQVQTKDTNKDGILSTSEAAKVTTASVLNNTTTICVFTYGINDLTGIKYFTNLEVFGIAGSDFTELNLSKDLDLSGMKNLKQVNINNPTNSTYSFKINLSNCTALTRLKINRMTKPITFDITGCANLEEIEFCNHVNSSCADLPSFYLSTDMTSHPKLKKITIRNNYFLEKIHIYCPTVTEMDLSNNTGFRRDTNTEYQNFTIGSCENLETLNLSGNLLTQEPCPFSNMQNLKVLKINDNRLTTLNISNNPKLLADPGTEVYLGAQKNDQTITVKMTEAQKANFDATNTKNTKTNISIIKGTGGSHSSDNIAPTISNKKLSLALSEDRRTITAKWDPATDNKTEQKNIRYNLYITDKANSHYLADPMANKIASVNGETGYITNILNTTSYSATEYLYAPSSFKNSYVDYETYYAVVMAIDESGNYSLYDIANITIDPTLPEISPTITNKELKVSVDDSRKRVIIEWQAATDKATKSEYLEYWVFLANEDAKPLLSDAYKQLAASNGQDGPVQSKNSTLTYSSTNCATAPHTVSYLKDGKYTALVIVTDSYGNYSYYNTADVLIAASDVNRDQLINATDVVSVYNYIINGAGSGITFKRANTNGDSAVNSADVVTIYNYIINGDK